MFSLICARINGWVNNDEAGDLRRHRAHYGVIVMCLDEPSKHALRCCSLASVSIISKCCFTIQGPHDKDKSVSWSSSWEFPYWERRSLYWNKAQGRNRPDHKRKHRWQLETLLTLKHRKTHGCVVSTVATDALALKHQAISIHNAD